MLGKHCLKAWSKTQSIIAKSSAESELYGIIKGSSEGLGLVALVGDFGDLAKVRVHVDATAAMGIVERRGLSRVRHIEVDHLWIQEQEARRMLPIEKVPGGDNPADLMTKNVGIDLATKHMRTMGIRFAEGRSEAAAKLHAVTTEEEWVCEKDGNELKIIKMHDDLREELFVPSGGDNYPVHNGDLQATRVTKGVTRSGKRFEVEDSWRRPGRANRRLEEAWVGCTEFYVKASARERISVALRRRSPGNARLRVLHSGHHRSFDSRPFHGRGGRRGRRPEEAIGEMLGDLSDNPRVE